MAKLERPPVPINGCLKGELSPETEKRLGALADKLRGPDGKFVRPWLEEKKKCSSDQSEDADETLPRLVPVTVR